MTKSIGVPDVRLSFAPRSSAGACNPPLPRHERASHTGTRTGMIDVMTVQIAIRLPDDMVAFLDKSVAAGNAPSRAALVARAVEREMRRQVAEQDAAILRERGTSDDLDELVAWSVAHVRVED